MNFMKNLQIGILGFMTWSGTVLAVDKIDGYLGAGFNIVSQQTSFESGTRNRIQLELGRLNKNVSLDAMFGNGLGYRDIGFTLGVFQLIPIPDEDSWFKMTLGGGLTGQFNSTAPKFWDWGVVLPQVRFIADFGIGLALSLNAGYELSFLRDFTDSSIGSVKTMKNRFVFGLSLLTTTDWFER